jgi:GNAT superfamily N-acetyltransferase
MDEIAVRACTVQDAEAVESLRVAGWKSAYRGMIPDAFLDSIPADAERRRRLTAARADAALENVAVLDGAIIGWVAAGPCRDDDRPGAHQGEVYACYVRPDWWRRGVGGLLFAHTTSVLARAGLADVTLWVLEYNRAARRFYESFGFCPDGSRKLLDLGEPVPEVRYRRVLAT